MSFKVGDEIIAKGDKTHGVVIDKNDRNIRVRWKSNKKVDYYFEQNYSYNESLIDHWDLKTKLHKVLE